MFETGPSTEKLHVAGVIGLGDLGSRNYAEIPAKKRRITPLCESIHRNSVSTNS
jgi:hypothetical protein